jgi:hypothetical protein
MGMNQDLARLYGTPGAAETSSEDLEKQAAADLFMKLAAENKVDLNQLTPEQIQDLWDYTFNKTASEGEEGAAHEGAETTAKEESEEESEEEKEAAAKKEAAAVEHAARLKMASDEAAADHLGRRMAHAYVQEVGYIGEAMAKQAEQEKQAQANASATKEAAAPQLGKGSAFRRLGHSAAAKWKDMSKGQKAAVGAGAAAAGVGAAAAMKGKKKEASVTDELAIERAIAKVAEANFDVDEAGRRIDALFENNYPDMNKMASDLETQIELRSLEILEAAGYPIQWEE